MKSILFVDDEPHVLGGLRRGLSRYRNKWAMSFAPGGEAALEELKRQSFDVIVSDMRMPGIDGATLLGRVQAEHPQMVRVVLSGYSELEGALRAVPVAHQFLTKPCAPHVLENVIERACSLHEQISEDAMRLLVGKINRLPCLPSVYKELLRELENGQSGAREVAQIIERDIAMSAKVLQLVNSGFFGQGKSIANVAEAVNYLGFSLLKSLVLTVEIFEMSEVPSRSGLSLDAMRRHSFFVADIAGRMLEADPVRRDEAFMAAVLHDIGKLILAVEMPDRMSEIHGQALASGRPQHEVERDVFGTTHAEMGGYLLGLWGLPYDVVEAVANHHTPERVQQQGLDALTATHVANALAHELAPTDDAVHRPLDVAYLERLGLAHELPHWRSVAEEHARYWVAT